MYDFFDKDHASNYLSSTIVRHDGRPTLVYGVETNQKKKLIVHHKPLRDNPETKVSKDPIDAFDFKPWRLGMFNFTHDGEVIEAAWTQRSPARRWKIGLDRAAISLVPCRQGDDNMIYDRVRHARDFAIPWYFSLDMANMLERVYPTLHEALAIMGKCTRRSVAFSPNFAVTGTKKLVYRHNDQPVGKVEDGVPFLFVDYQDLREILMEEFR